MSEMPKEAKFDYGARDVVTGARWVYVSREMARGHPKGGLSLPIYAIVLMLVGSAAIWFYEFVSYGFELGALLLSLVPMLAALGLMLQSPVAVTLVVIMFAMTAYNLITGIEFLNALGLLQLIALGSAVGYLLEGARPNLIYKHRYRSFKGPK